MYSKSIYKLGIHFRNPLISKNLNLLLESQNWPIERIQEFQIKKCRELFQHAFNHSPFYRKIFTACGLDPNQIKNFDQLKQIPLSSKKEIISNRASIQNYATKGKHFYSETSGSSGKPLVFYRNADWDAWHRASVFRGYRWHGVNPWDKNGYLWGYNFSLKRKVMTRFFDLLQNRFRLFSYDETEIDQFIEKLHNANFLSGYSSMIYEIAKRINNRKIDHQFNLKMIKGTSEKIFPRYQDEVKRAFGRKMISEYGSAEGGIIAFECPSGTQHINMETTLVEVIENEIVITNLVSLSFPIIRYRLGDYVELGNKDICKCGMCHPAITEIMGRVGKVIYGQKKQYPSLTLYYVFKNLAMEHEIILSYQAIQSRRGYLEIHIEEKLNNLSLNLLKKEFHKYFLKDIEFKIFENANLKSGTKKRVDFISLLSD